jgi:hypothetical protein
MFETVINIFSNIKEYFRYVLFGDKDEIILKEIYRENNVDLNKIYNQLTNVNKHIAKEKDFEKILNYVNREIKYETELTNYEKILDLELETPDKVKRIELMTNLCDLKKSFEKIILIKNEYYHNYDKKDQ